MNIEQHIKLAMQKCSLTEEQEGALLTGIENYLSELEQVKTCNKPAVSKSVDVEREALLRDYTDWLWINHNILTNANNNEVAINQYLSRNSC